MNHISHSSFQENLERTQEAIQHLSTLFATPPEQFLSWNQSLVNIQKRLQSSITRIAIVGTVKSGKSSFLNSLLQEDLLKRGAGIITAMITRVRHSPTRKVTLRFKSWHMINQEIREAMNAIAPSTTLAFDSKFEIQNNEHRNLLKEFLDTTLASHSSDLQENQHLILLTSFYQGYDYIHSYIEEKVCSVILDESQFLEHQHFVDNDAHAIYMEDILLGWPQIPKFIEVADCQGIDSPNPLHFAMVQEYLSTCSQIFYVISSRTGIRQADFLLMRTLQQFGLLQQTLFILNIDLNECDDLQSWQQQTQRIRVGLSRWVPLPEIFCISCLYQLFFDIYKHLLPKQRLQFELWESSPDLVELHHSQWKKIEQKFFKEMVSSVHLTLLAGETIHWKYLVHRILDFIQLWQNLFQKKSENLEVTLQSLQSIEVELQNILSSVQMALQGVIPQIKQSLQLDMNQLLDPKTGSIIAKIFQFIENYEFSPALPFDQKTIQLQVIRDYDELHSQMLGFIVKKCNAVILNHLSVLQQRYIEQIKEAIFSTQRLLETSLQKYVHLLQELHSSQFSESFQWQPTQLEFPDIPFQSFSSSLKYRRNEQFKHLFLFAKNMVGDRLSQWFSKTEKNKKSQDAVYHQFLEESRKLVKKRAMESLDFDILNYRENLKYQYMLKGIQQLTETVYQELQETIQTTLVDHQKLFQLAREHQRTTEKQPQELQKIFSSLQNFVSHST